MPTATSRFHNSSSTQRTLPLVLEPLWQQHGIDALLLDCGKYVLGSGDDCSVHIPVPGIRPRHCLIVANESGATLEAVDPHTWLNDGPVQQSVLRPGDRLAIGPIEFRLRRARIDEFLPSGLQQQRSDIAQPTVPGGHHVDHGRSQQVADTQSIPGTTDHSQSVKLADETERLAQLDAELRQRAKQLDRKEIELQDAADRQTADFENQRRALTRQQEDLSRQQSAVDTAKISLDESTAQLRREIADVEQNRAQLKRTRDALADSEHWAEQEMKQLRDEQETLRAEKATLQAERMRNDREQTSLQQEHASLAAERQSLHDLRTELQQKQHELEEEWQERSHNRDSLSVQHEELDQRRAALDTESERLENLQTELQATQAELAEHETEFQQRQQTLDTESERLESLRAELQATRAELAERETKFQQRQQTLDAESERLENLRAELQATQAVLTERETEFQQRQQTLDAESERLESLRAELQATQAELAERETKFQQRQQALDAESERLENLQTELQATQAVLTERETEFQQRQQALDAESERLENLQTELQATQAELAERETEFQQRQQALDAESEIQSERAAETDELLRQNELLETERHALETDRAQWLSEAAQITRDCDRLAVLEKQLADERAWLDDDRQRIADQRDRLAKDQQELERQREQLSARGRELEGESERLKSLQDELDVRQSALSESESQTTEEHESRNAERLRLEQQQAELNREREQLQDLRRELDDRQTELATARAQFEEEQRTVDNCNEERFGEHESSTADDDEPDEVAADDSELDTFDLHTAVAEMFDIPSQPATDDVPSTDSEEPVCIADSPDEQIASMRTMLSSLIAEEDAMTVSAGKEDVPVDESLSRDAGAEPGESIEAPSDSESKDDQPVDVEDPDSITAYMERLLARTRRRDHSEPVRLNPSPVASPASVSQEVPASNVAEDRPETTFSDTPAVDLATLGPAHRQNKDEIRAKVDSLRELANLSARTAIATHTRRKAYSHLTGKILLAVVAVGLTVLLYSSVYWGTSSYATYGWSAALVCAVTLIELARSFWEVSHVGSPAGGSAPSVTIPISAESPSSATDDSAEPDVAPEVETMEQTLPVEQSPHGDRSHSDAVPAVSDFVQTAEQVEST